MKKWILTLAMISIAGVLTAQENELDPVTVTSAMVPEKASKTGRNIISISGDRFASLPVSSIDELLRYLPGIEMQMRGPSGSQSDISLRGSTFQQVLVLLDGVRLNDPNTGHFSAYIPIAPAEIERVEVLKGASSAVYGSEAVGGVIHVITKTFAAKNGVSRHQVKAEVAAGEYGLFNASAGVFYQKNKTAAAAGILSNNASGQPQRGIRGFFHNNTASASLHHFFSRHWSLGLRGAFDTREFAAQNFYTTFTSDTAAEKVTTAWSQLQLSYQRASSRLRILAGYKQTNDTYRYNSNSAPNQSRSALAQASVIYDQRVSTVFNFLTGVQYQKKSIQSNDRGDHDLNQAGVFASANLRPATGLILNPSLRLDLLETIGAELIPQLNISYQLHHWQLRASAGKTIRDADFTERYNNYNKSFVTSGRIGNPDLEAERSFSYEAGVDYLRNNQLKLSATFFQRYHNKLIDWVVTPYAGMPRKSNLSPTGTYALARNIARVTTTGIEADLQYIREFNNASAATANLGIVWLQDKSSEGTPSFYISSHARYLLNGNIEYRYKIISIALTAVYKSRAAQSAPAIQAKVSSDYMVFNSRVELRIPRTKLSGFAVVDNIFDRSYQDLLGSQMPGRWLMGGLKLSF